MTLQMNENKKRKRTKNTTAEQYELYLNAIENDYALKSNCINPTLEPNYLSNKWNELSQKLNAIGEGPALSGEEWKKRFADWKYSTKAKFRKIHYHGIKTGGGPATEIRLNALEERALSAWGMVTVEGDKGVTTYEGVSDNTETEKTIENFDLEPSEEYQENQSSLETEEVINPMPSTSEIHTLSTSGAHTPSSKRVRPKPLSELAQNLIKTTDSNIKILETFNKNFWEASNAYLAIKKKNSETKERELEFQIKKYKFEHPDFDF